MRIDGYTRLAAVVAHPIKHSISPFIHNRAFELTGINGVYLAFDIPSEELEETVKNIKRYDMWGINLSMPYKKAVIPYLDQLAPEAQLIEAVNTVVNQNGQLIGYNTDGKGFFKHLNVAFSFEIKNQTMTLMGAGGAAQALMVQAALNGAKIIHVFRRRENLQASQAFTDKLHETTGVKITVEAIEDQEMLHRRIQQSALLVNATSVGMDARSCPLDLEVRLPQDLLVADIIYQPFETPLLRLARKQGLKATNGLGMLLYQAAEAFQYWTNQEMPVDQIWQELIEKYQD